MLWLFILAVEIENKKSPIEVSSQAKAFFEALHHKEGS